ncbi:O-antigen ligase family protein [Paenibacillus sp. BSR1-1]|uniref:O-antigen ligase family protein n=1 Tax=Paenibacillus sp. BSR1-1 TaxID=3020845 RepID=UPI0025B07A9A|nr:O-antigen ligase family protein [Paenibacillus sp. BSR1-1]MDN3018497.1 O-antigen ligase family protein [Paenibacillus sp. BSR1-1]
MYWFIVLFPLMIYPWGIDPYYTTTKTNYLYLFVVAAWLFIIFKRKHHTLLPGKDESKAIYILLAFLSLVELSTAFSNYTYSSVYGSIDRKEGLITFFSYGSVFLFSYKLVDLKKVNKVFPGIAIVSMIVSVYGILQHYSLDFLPRNSAMRGYTGTYTFFDNPNFFGSYLVLILLVSMMMYLTEKNKKLLSLYFIASNLGFITLIFSSTRSGYVGVFCGTVFLSLFVVLKRKYLWKKWAFLLITLGLMLLVINISENDQYFNRINSVVTDTYSVASNQSTGHEGSSRFFIWEKSLPLVPKYFWVGSGPDTFEFVFKASPKELQEFFGDPNITVDKAHNEYLQIAITLGTPALLTYLLFIFVIFRRAFKAVRQAEGNEKLILYGLIATIIGYLVQAFFNISTVPVAPIFWAILGITMAKSEFILKNAKAVHQFEEVTEKSA